MRPIPRLMLDLSATFAACAVAAPTLAFAQGDRPAASAPEGGSPEARRQMLNTDQAKAAQAQVEANTASDARHDTAVALDGMQSAREGAQYADALARHDAAQDAYRHDRKQWERTNPYCWDGDATRCPPEPSAPGSGN